MPTLLQVAELHPKVQARLDRDYSILRAELAAIDDGWLAQHAAAVQGVVTNGQYGLPAALIQALPGLGVIGINGVGYDKIDLALAKSRGIRVANTPDVLTDDVADLAVGLTLTLLRQLVAADTYVRDGSWFKAEAPLATKMSGKRVGIFGLGRIGRATARRFAGFTDHIAYAGPKPQDVPYTYHPTAEALAAACDVLVLCAPATPATRRIIGDAVFNALGPKGVLVNVARGAIVDEAALVAALEQGRLGGAALDVYEDEPRVPPALLAMRNVILTPHIASATNETRQAMGDLMMDNIDAHFAGRALPTALV
jgi:lactate dehydrogenase-like 2-hydroxyacid dehydrogenase